MISRGLVDIITSQEGPLTNNDCVSAERVEAKSKQEGYSGHVNDMGDLGWLEEAE